MGMFDYLRCDYPLPVRAAAQGAHMEFQTKSLDHAMDCFHIRADGTLWREDYDVEDHSDPTAQGVARLVGMMTRVNKHWKFMGDFTGEVEFYGGYGQRNRNGWHDGHVRFNARFVEGALTEVVLMEEEVSPSTLAEEAALALDADTAMGGHHPGAAPARL